MERRDRLRRVEREEEETVLTSRKQVFRAMQAAYVRLLQNPFFDPDEHSPPGGRGGKKITSRKFTEEMRRIGETWAPGVGNL